MNSRRVQWTVLLVIVALAAVVRIYQLKDLPAGFFCDEAAEGYNAYLLGTTGYDENGEFLPVYIWSFGTSYKNPLVIYTAAAVMRFFGVDEFTTRLPPALFGILGVIAIFLLGRTMVSPWVGIFAAVLLAFCPWHIHFSRITFDMTVYALLFTCGFTLLCAFLRGRRTLPLAAFFFSFCVYAYAVSALFVPLFLLGTAVVCAPVLLRHWRQTLLALVVAAATVAPGAWFHHTHRRSTQYFSRTTILNPAESVRTNVERFARNYREFFSPAFLLDSGDPIVRHAVRGFGELLPLRLPVTKWNPPPWLASAWPQWRSLTFDLLFLGGLVACLRGRPGWLLLWWLALYPVGASLMTEVPSATRAFIGVPAFCLLVAIGLAAVLHALGRLAHWRPLALTVQTAALGGVAALFVPEAYRYLDHYFHEYAKYSAVTYGGFQFGYRDSIHYMESQRKNYDLLMLTSTDVNMPQIFPLFYNRINPRGPAPQTSLNYLISDPAYYADYQLNQRVLYQLHPKDLAYFNDYTIKKRIEAPGGQVDFVVAEVRQRKRFLTQWLVLGLFDNTGQQGTSKDFIDPRHVTRSQYAGAFGDVYWRPVTLRNVRVDLNIVYGRSDPRSPGNPEWVCAYAVTDVRSEVDRPGVYLEIAGSDDPLHIWLNGVSLTPAPLMPGEAPQRRIVDLKAGENLLLVKSCERIGSWEFTVRLTDADGVDVPGITATPDIPVLTETAVGPADAADQAGSPPPAPQPAAQMVEGFGTIVAYKHTGVYQDYRGGTESWWVSQNDPDAQLVWRTAPCPEQKQTVVAFTASTAVEPAEADLYVNGSYALSFSIGGENTERTWSQGAYQMRFIPKGEFAGHSGIVVLVVPESAVTAGQPLEFRVVPTKGLESAWFMIKSYADTIGHEGLSAADLLDSMRNQWQSAGTATP